MKLLVLSSVLFLGVFSYSTSHAADPLPPKRSSVFTIQIRGLSGYLTDSVKGAILEHDGPQSWDLFITGATGKSQFSCEVRSADRNLLVNLQRSILEAPELTLQCANAQTGKRGGALVDLDDSSGKGGSFVLGATRKD